MIGWLFDTNVAQELEKAKGAIRVRSWAATQPAATVFISILTIAEFDKGIANLRDDDPRRAAIAVQRDELAAVFGGRILPVSDPVAKLWGTISGRVKRDTGHPPPVVDTLLAATAIEHDLYLVTRNVRDVRLSGAAVFNPWDDDPASAALSARRRGR
ncbi:MAG: type II toxin-antitoxin system VapC family toxin [Janthinobacterium lividum]